MKPADLAPNAADSIRPLQDFPNPAVEALSVETVSLEALVRHRGWVPHSMPLEQVEKAFRERDTDYLALVREDRVTGICSRLRLGAILGSRFGFALYSQSGAYVAQVDRPLVFDRDTPVRKILDQAMARHGDEFHDDVVLVDANLGLLGLIPVEALAHLQSQLVFEQLRELQHKNETLQRHHVDLFKTNHALRQAQALYHGLFESSTLGVALLSTTGRIQTSNRRLAELLNHDEDRMAGLDLRGLVTDDAAQMDRLLRGYDGNRTASAVGEFTLQIPGRGSRLFQFTTGWIAETGQICACLQDITESREIERRMHRYEKQQFLDTMIGGIAHELNNKLTPVLGFAGLIEFEGGGSTRDYATQITKSVREAAEMIRQLLQLTKPNAIQQQRLELNRIVDESLALMKFKLMEAKCEARVQRGLRPVHVFADPVQLGQVLMNLLLNALQALEGLEIPVLTVEVGHRGPHAAVCIADNGCGIAPEHLGRIFDPFFTTKSEDKGTGLGLSISQGIARQHGGEITVESEPGRGARFTLTLPAMVAPGPAAGPPATQDDRGHARRSIKPGTRILIVDDESAIRQLLQEIIRAHFDCGIDVAANGIEALRFVERAEYGLIVSDIRMPGMNGPEFYERLRNRHPAMAGRVLFVTGHAGDQALQARVAQWQVPVLAKPFSVNSLVAVCESLLVVPQ